MQCGFTFEQHYSDPAPSRWNFHLEPDAGPRILNHGHFNEKINENHWEHIGKFPVNQHSRLGKPTVYIWRIFQPRGLISSWLITKVLVWLEDPYLPWFKPNRFSFSIPSQSYQYPANDISISSDIHFTNLVAGFKPEKYARQWRPSSSER